MDALADAAHHAPVRVLPHIKRLDDCFGDFLVRVVCECGACREIQPQALARLVGWKMTLKELALRMRCSKCGKKAAEVSIPEERRNNCGPILLGVHCTQMYWLASGLRRRRRKVC